MRKGYIGAIGDDLPAIFPLLMRLVLFFSAFKLSYDDYIIKNEQIRLFRASMEIASVMESDGAVTPEEFESRCRDAQLLGVDYRCAFYIDIPDSPVKIVPCRFPVDRDLEKELEYMKRINSLVFPITIYYDVADPNTGRTLVNTTISMLRVRTWHLA